MYCKLEWFGLENETAASPRVHLASNSVIYLKSQTYGPHHKEQKIVCIDRDGRRTVDTASSDVYRGMYNQAFPDRCWSTSGEQVFFTSPCKSSIQSYFLQLGKYATVLSTPTIDGFGFIYFLFFADSSVIHRLSLPDGCTGSIILDVFDDVILLNGVSLTRPDQLFVGRINYTELDKPISWIPVSSGNCFPTDLSLSTDLLSFPLADDMEYEV